MISSISNFVDPANSFGCIHRLGCIFFLFTKTESVRMLVIPDFKDKTRYAPYVSFRSQISHTPTNKG